MVKNLNYKKILILSTPISFLVGPLILEIILIITSITFLYDEKKETLKNNLNNIFFKFFFGFSAYLLFSFIIFQRFDEGYTYSVFYFRYIIYFFFIILFDL